ncbi:MAG TPA: MarR family winged helix-turn-helix transcriptional regulator [Fibrobacteria bacterium]|nr:MarR family winged helix-turn-helix transcriptional regulator [Fibrobacteria bacterium]
MNEMPGNRSNLPKIIGEQCFCLHSRMTARAVTRRYNSILASLGLEVTEFSLLAALTIGKDVSITTLAERLAFERTTLVRNLKKMAARGLIKPSGDKGRAVRYLLTKRGHQALEEALPLWVEAQKSVLGQLEGRDAKGVLNSLNALRRAAKFPG